MGEDAVVIGMGPSLRPGDLDRFAGKVTFACNKIYLAYDQTDWRPTYYSCIDVLVAKNNFEEIGQVAGSTKIFPRQMKKDLPEMEDAIFYEYYANLREESTAPTYSANPIKGGISGGATVLLAQINMAYWMGCRRVYLVGLDFSFALAEKTNEVSAHGEGVLVNRGELNHFHKDYRKSGETWTMPKMDEQREGFLYAKAAYESDGRQLLNASRSSKLDVLERVDFDEVFPTVDVAAEIEHS